MVVGFRFDIVGMAISTRTMAGMWWEDWPASSCPILLVHGKKTGLSNWKKRSVWNHEDLIQNLKFLKHAVTVSILMI